MPNSLLISCLGKRHATCSGAETKRCVWESGCRVGILVAAISFAETEEGQDKRSCKQSADQRSNTCAPCLQHTYGGKDRGGGDERMCEWCEEGVSFGVESDLQICQFGLNVKRWIPKRMMISDQRNIRFSYENTQRPTMILTTMTSLYVKREKLRNMMHEINTSPIRRVAQRERESCKQMKRRGRVG